MTFVSITRLRIRSARFLPMFLLDTWLSARQVKRAGGYRGGQMLADRERTYWTMTAWDDARLYDVRAASSRHAETDALVRSGEHRALGTG